MSHSKSTELKTFTITDPSEEIRIDQYLSKIHGINSRSKAVKLIKDNHVSVNGKLAKPSTLLHVGNQVEVRMPVEKTDVGLLPYDFNLNILYEDEDILVVDKPSGLVVHPSHGHEQDTLVNALIFHCKDLSMGFNENRPGIVHRIDKDTSGLLVVAKNDFAHEHLAQQFKAKATYRKYFCICIGHPKFMDKKVESTIARHPTNRKKYASEKHTDNPKGKVAVSHFKVMECFTNGLSLIQCRLETGRTHQIRVHISEEGFPIVGDELYGGATKVKSLKSVALRKKISEMNRFALHAATLGFVHPTSHKTLSFNSPWPDNLKELVPGNFNINELIKND